MPRRSILLLMRRILPRNQLGVSRCGARPTGFFGWTANVGVPVVLCYVIASKQKRSGWWALAGILHIWGILLVACLPSPHTPSVTDQSSDSDRAWYDELAKNIARHGILGSLPTMGAVLATIVGISMFAFALVMLVTGAGTVRVNGEIVEAAGKRAMALIEGMVVAAVFGVVGILYLRFVRPAVLRAGGHDRLEQLRRRSRRR
jgi:hypothetical protein